MNITLSDEQYFFEQDIKKNAPEPREGIQYFDMKQQFIAGGGKRVMIYAPVWRRAPITNEYTVLGYWLREITDEPVEFFFKSVQYVHEAVKQKKIRCI